MDEMTHIAVIWHIVVFAALCAILNIAGREIILLACGYLIGYAGVQLVWSLRSKEK
jgi:hypothetical protein